MKKNPPPKIGSFLKASSASCHKYNLELILFKLNKSIIPIDCQTITPQNAKRHQKVTRKLSFFLVEPVVLDNLKIK